MVIKQSSNISMFGVFKSFEKSLGSAIYLLILLAIFGSVFEILGILLIVPVFYSLDSNYNASSGAFEWYLEILGDEPSILLTVALVFLMFILRSAMNYIAIFQGAMVRSRFLSDLREGMLQRLVDTKEILQKEACENALNLLNEQASRSQTALLLFQQTINLFFSFLIYTVAAVLIAPVFACASIIVGLIVVFAFRPISRKTQDNSMLISKLAGQLLSQADQLLTNIKYIKITKRSSFFVDEIQRNIRRIQDIQINTGMYIAFSTAFKEPLLIFGLLMLVVYQVETGMAEVTVMVAALAALYRASTALGRCQNQWQKMMEWYGSYILVTNETSRPILEREVGEVGEGCNRVHSLHATSLSYRYPEMNEDVFEPISFTLAAPALAIVKGQSGAGKSTFLDLILGIRKPSEGSLIMIGDDGMAAAGARAETIGYVDQNPFLIKGTIIQNITLTEAIEDVDFSIAERCINDVGLQDWFEKFDNDWNTPLLDGTNSLSGGELQRLAIARELYRSPSLLILDEPTSALDPASANMVFSMVKKLSKTELVIVVTHDSKFDQLADLVVNIQTKF